MDPHMVKTVLRCGRCHHEMEMCVRVHRGVPAFLRCNHASHGGPSRGGSGGLACPQCSCDWHIDGDRLVAMVEAALAGGMQEWKQRGAVVIDCG